MLVAGGQNSIQKRHEKPCRGHIYKNTNASVGVWEVDVPKFICGFSLAPKTRMLLTVLATRSVSSEAVVVSKVFTFNSFLYAKPHITFTPLCIILQTFPWRKTVHYLSRTSPFSFITHLFYIDFPPLQVNKWLFAILLKAYCILNKNTWFNAHIPICFNFFSFLVKQITK